MRTRRRINLEDLYNGEIPENIFLHDFKLEKQPNTWYCGPAALHYSLLYFGRLVDIKQIGNDAGTTKSGTDEKNLAQAAKKYMCLLKSERYFNPEMVRKRIIENLKKNKPILICVDNWQHWLCVIHCRKNKFLVLDSSRKSKTIKIFSWEKLAEKLKYIKDDKEIYDISILSPKFKKQKCGARFFSKN